MFGTGAPMAGSGGAGGGTRGDDAGARPRLSGTRGRPTLSGMPVGGAPAEEAPRGMSNRAVVADAGAGMLAARLAAGDAGGESGFLGRGGVELF